MADAAPAIRGPDAVRRSLIDAAKHLMSMRSPRQVSGRELAQHAGVNYGLIHHYFGTKDNVFAEAVAEATETMAERWDRIGILPVNTTDEAASYRTFAKLEVDESRSPIRTLMRRIVEHQGKVSGRPTDDPEMLAEIAIATALQFGWGAFESDIVDALQEYGGDLEDLRTRVSELSNRLRRDDTDD
ncbi:MAG TPA: helix-turn-helix domain-containing protein [Acidimicrobiia bacterium]|nr:helix-turn-helix domain-containing protein [Acidimicrobiia bacterium]